MNSRSFPPDPVIEAYKRDLDESLLRQSLQRTPEQRILAIMEMNRLVEEMRRAMKAASNKR
jgi:hypothetical protein